MLAAVCDQRIPVPPSPPLSAAIVAGSVATASALASPVSVATPAQSAANSLVTIRSAPGVVCVRFSASVHPRCHAVVNIWQRGT